MTASIVAMLFNVGLNLAIIPILGPTGAAIATTAAYLFEAIILCVLCTRLFGFARIDRAMAESVVAGGLMALFLAFVHIGTIPDLLLAGALYSAAWLMLCWRFAPQNVAVLRSFFRRAGPTPDDEGTAIAWETTVGASEFGSDGPEDPG